MHARDAGGPILALPLLLNLTLVLARDSDSGPSPSRSPSPNALHCSVATVAKQAACECVCDLHGMHDVEDDLKGSLLMAIRFPRPQPQPEAEAAGGAEAGEAGAAAEAAEAEAAEAAEDEDAEVAKLQERSSTLKRFVGLMEEGLLAQKKELPSLQQVLKNQMDFQYQRNEVPELLQHVMGQPGQSGKAADHQMQSQTLALCRATLLVGKPSAVREAGGGGGESRMAILSEVQRSIGDLYEKLRDAALDNNSEVVAPSPDVSAAEWDACKEELRGLQED